MTHGHGTIPLKEGWRFIKDDDPDAAGLLDQPAMSDILDRATKGSQRGQTSVEPAGTGPSGDRPSGDRPTKRGQTSAGSPKQGEAEPGRHVPSDSGQTAEY